MDSMVMATIKQQQYSTTSIIISSIQQPHPS
jgi:hypothetical protein